MAGYMEGAARMVRAEGLESARAGAEHRRVLEHAEDLLRRSEEFLEQQGVEAGAAASGAPPSGSAALDRDARLLGDIDAFVGKAEAEAKDEPMADASKEERSTSEELVPDDPESLYYRAHKSASRVPQRLARRRPGGPGAEEPADRVQSQAVLSVGQLDLLLLRGRQPAGVRRLFLPTGWRPFRGRPVWKQEGDRSLVP